MSNKARKPRGDKPFEFSAPFSDTSRKLRRPSFTAVAEFQENAGTNFTQGEVGGRAVFVPMVEVARVVVAGIAALVRCSARLNGKDEDRYLTDEEVGDLMDPDDWDTYAHIVRVFFDPMYDPEPAPNAESGPAES